MITIITFSNCSVCVTVSNTAVQQQKTFDVRKKHGRLTWSWRLVTYTCITFQISGKKLLKKKQYFMVTPGRRGEGRGGELQLFRYTDMLHHTWVVFQDFSVHFRYYGSIFSPKFLLFLDIMGQFSLIIFCCLCTFLYITSEWVCFSCLPVDFE